MEKGSLKTKNHSANTATMCKQQLALRSEFWVEKFPLCWIAKRSKGDKDKRREEGKNKFPNIYQLCLKVPLSRRKFILWLTRFKEIFLANAQLNALQSTSDKWLNPFRWNRIIISRWEAGNWENCIFKAICQREINKIKLECWLKLSLNERLDEVS